MQLFQQQVNRRGAPVQTDKGTGVVCRSCYQQVRQPPAGLCHYKFEWATNSKNSEGKWRRVGDDYSWTAW